MASPTTGFNHKAPEGAHSGAVTSGYGAAKSDAKSKGKLEVESANAKTQNVSPNHLNPKLDREDAQNRPIISKKIVVSDDDLKEYREELKKIGRTEKEINEFVEEFKKNCEED